MVMLLPSVLCVMSTLVPPPLHPPPCAQIASASLERVAATDLPWSDVLALAAADAPRSAAPGLRMLVVAQRARARARPTPRCCRRARCRRRPVAMPGGGVDSDPVHVPEGTARCPSWEPDQRLRMAPLPPNR